MKLLVFESMRSKLYTFQFQLCVQQFTKAFRKSGREAMPIVVIRYVIYVGSTDVKWRING